MGPTKLASYLENTLQGGVDGGVRKHRDYLHHELHECSFHLLFRNFLEPLFVI
jgi:hypothetical protein